MRATLRENLAECWEHYIVSKTVAPELRVVELATKPDYDSAEVAALLDVAVEPLVLAPDSEVIPAEDSSVDVLLGLGVLNERTDVADVFEEITRVVRPGGVVILVSPSAGPEGRGLHETVALSPAAYESLAQRHKLPLIDVWVDERGGSFDVVGVFTSGVEHRSAPDLRSVDLAEVANKPDPSWALGNNLVQGERHYLACLTDLHTRLAPRLYFEIGVWNGRSLELATGPAIGVDPHVELLVTLPDTATIVEATSDAYFAAGTADQLGDGPDLSFIDGMHLFEYVLRDFMNVERRSPATATVVIDDVLPNHPDQATRVRGTTVWMGDVWKITEVLRRFRPDLELTLLDTAPSGLLLIAGLDPDNTVLWDNYNDVVAWAEQELLAPGPEIAARTQAHPAEGPDFDGLLDRLARTQLPELSLVIVAYDMARELPRTLVTLTAEAQGLTPHTYELIVVDNGSPQPLDQEVLAEIAPDARFMSVENPTSSPARAVNLGLQQARGRFIAVIVDGARMASPGLLRRSLECLSRSDRAVVGSVGFHLGNVRQSTAIQQGYDEHAEDDLLATVPWRQDGYSLFEISVLAPSSAGGWFQTPAETSAIVMSRSLWTELNGYDEQFVCSGGGLMNHDVWERACELPDVDVFMLLGEGTFHQVHGGVSTNAVTSRWPEFATEYEQLRGRPYQRRYFPATFVGELTHVLHPPDGIAKRRSAENLGSGQGEFSQYRYYYFLQRSVNRLMRAWSRRRDHTR